jgi:glycosyltransferase involved in cell wall biosynthesis
MQKEKSMKIQKVSVVMCTYNGAKYLREQLDSIVNQTYPIYEFIIQDDRSTDTTFDILTEYAQKYPFIHLHHNERQKGINENFFSAMHLATGDYIALSDQDDIWVLDKLKIQIENIGDCWLSGGFTEPFSEGNVPVRIGNRKPNMTIERLIYLGAIAGHTILISRNMLQFTPPHTHYLTLYDHILTIFAAAYDKIHYTEQKLVCNRRSLHAATYTVPLDDRRCMDNYFKIIFRTFFNYCKLRPEMRNYFFHIYQLLKSLPEKNSVKADAQKMAYLHTQKGLINYLKLARLCVKYRKKIFYVEEKNALLSVLRAIYFPISCSDYFRFLSKSYKKN